MKHWIMAAALAAAAGAPEARAAEIDWSGLPGAGAIVRQLRAEAKDAGAGPAGRELTEEEIRRSIDDFFNEPGSGKPGERWKCAGKAESMTREEMLRWIPGRRANCRRVDASASARFRASSPNLIARLRRVTCRSSFKPDHQPREYRTRLQTIGLAERGIRVETLADEGAGRRFTIDHAYRGLDGSIELIGSGEGGGMIRLFMGTGPEDGIGWGEAGFFDAELIIDGASQDYSKYGCRVEFE